jgi:hypothetical protein
MPRTSFQAPLCFRSIAAFTALAGLPLLLGTRPVRADSITYYVTNSNWGEYYELGTFAYALSQSNANPGRDTIIITPGLAINVDLAPDTGGWLTTISDYDGVNIEGNGATLVGNPSFRSSDDILYTKTNVGVMTDGDRLNQRAFSFAKVSRGVSVNIDALNTDGLNGYLQLDEGLTRGSTIVPTTASLSNATSRNSVSYGVDASSVFQAFTNSTLNLSQVVLENINPALDSIGPAWSGAISGVNATLNMVRSSISQVAAAAGAVVWSGGVANVVSSLISESGGLSVSDETKQGVMNLVNSLVSVKAQDSDFQRLQAFAGGILNIKASSVLQDAYSNTYSSCSNYPYACAGKPLTAFNGGTITLEQSLVSLLNTDRIPADVDSYSEAALGFDPYSDSDGDIVALDSVWIQPTPNQSAADLQSLLSNPSLLTSGIPLTLEDLGRGLSAYYPLPGGAYPNPDGPLIDQISDANGANQLRNPIDDSPILLDVFGNPRTRNGLRTIGAVQPASAPAPLPPAGAPAPLPLAGATAALAWSRRLRRRIRNAQAPERVENLD